MFTPHWPPIQLYIYTYIDTVKPLYVEHPWNQIYIYGTFREVVRLKGWNNGDMGDWVKGLYDRSFQIQMKSSFRKRDKHLSK